MYIGWGRTFNPDAKVVQVDIETEEIGRNRIVDIPVISDINKFLIKLNSNISSLKKFENWMNIVREWKDLEWKEVDKLKSDNSTPMHVLRVVKAVEEVLDGNCMLCIDGGDTQAWTDSSYVIKNAW